MLLELLLGVSLAAQQSLCDEDAGRERQLQLARQLHAHLGGVLERVLARKENDAIPFATQLLMLASDDNVLVSYGQNENTLSGIAYFSGSTDAATRQERFSSSFSASTSSSLSTYPLSALSHDEAVQLLIHLGCVSDLRQRTSSIGDVDGEALSEFDDVTILQELEQDRSVVRTTKLKAVLKKLQALQRYGVAPQVLSTIRDQIADNMVK
eukprot:gene38995-47435_t